MPTLYIKLIHNSWKTYEIWIIQIWSGKLSLICHLPSEILIDSTYKVFLLIGEMSEFADCFSQIHSIEIYILLHSFNLLYFQCSRNYSFQTSNLYCLFTWQGWSFLSKLSNSSWYNFNKFAFLRIQSQIKEKIFPHHPGRSAVDPMEKAYIFKNMYILKIL